MNPIVGEIFPTRPDRPWGSPSILYNAYWVSFPEVKRPGRGVNHPPPSTAEVKERVELYLYPSWPSWPVLGWYLFLLKIFDIFSPSRPFSGTHLITFLRAGSWCLLFRLTTTFRVSPRSYNPLCWRCTQPVPPELLLLSAKMHGLTLLYYPYYHIVCRFCTLWISYCRCLLRLQHFTCLS
jgi:hypothetical protein